MPDYQKNILEAIYSDLSVIDEYGLKPSMFTGDYKKLFQAFKEIYDKGLEVDAELMLGFAERFGFSISIFSDLDRFRGNAKFYVDAHLEKLRIEKLRLLQYKISDCIGEGQKSDEIINEIEKELTSIIMENEKEVTGVKDIIIEVVKNIEERGKLKGKLTGIPSGYPWIDKFTGGFHNGDLIILGARTSIGKTAFQLSMINKIASTYPVGIYSGEMDIKILTERLIAINGDVNLLAIRTGGLKPVDYHNITEAAGFLYSSNILIDDTPGIKLNRLKSKMRIMRKKGAEIIFIDYLTKINNKFGALKRHEQVGEISETLKNMARELDIPVVALSQVGRGTEGKMPTLADLRESGDIEQDADLIIFLHRDRDEVETVAKIAKHRNGPLGKADLLFRKKSASFVEDTIENRE